jgi:hypothetical protein
VAEAPLHQPPVHARKADRRKRPGQETRSRKPDRGEGRLAKEQQTEACARLRADQRGHDGARRPVASVRWGKRHAIGFAGAATNPLAPAALNELTRSRAS